MKNYTQKWEELNKNGIKLLVIKQCHLRKKVN